MLSYGREAVKFQTRSRNDGQSKMDATHTLEGASKLSEEIRNNYGEGGSLGNFLSDSKKI